ncbi:AAA family ATPase [Bacteroides thetaiotaomicron]|uniref:AAA family ATPase n=1 Tax=Bacteroides thetaiotaomicron TaxID=818 RepID=UPI001F35B32B|nr:ATP-binding protein [Bacteroides thetaiotaomicron]MCE8952369.1 ATP-binding protein [Bacteroides thetaiotaomicron]MCE8969725.1 ATP-binding protein [Bacteroides thetaiotaomicron]
MIFLYGDNGAGKSKLLMAFDILQHLVTTIRDDKMDSLPFFEFALDPYKEKSQPSEIEMVYHFDKNRYRYYIKWNESVILEERLTLLKIVTEAELFNRWYDFDEKVVKVKYGRAMNMDDDTAFVIRTSLLRNNSVISIIASTNIYNKVLHDQLSFFRNGFELVELSDIDLGEMLPDGKKIDGRKLKKVILALLKSIGSNIVNFEKIPLPKRIPSTLRARMKNMSEEDQQIMMAFWDQAPDYAVKTYHDIGGKRPQPLDLEVQSEGTKEILRLILCMHEAIAEHKTILLDDCINGIHPKTLEQLMKFYLGASEDSQLIIASQNFSNLDGEMLRRDSLRFIVKNTHGESRPKQMNLGDLHKNQNLRMQIENSEKWGVKPIIDEVILEETIREYRNEMIDIDNSYFSELF